jgi:uncharacterized protein YoxC
MTSLRHIEQRLERIEQKVDLLLGVTVGVAKKEKLMFDEIIAAVDEQSTVIDGAITAFNGLAAKVQELVSAGTVSPEQVTALANAIRANSQKLADAVAANTPAQ